VEAYVDDIVVKSLLAVDLISDLAETFTSLRAYSIKLNPKKCIFGVSSSKLLRFMAS
jgi:hypothetical protein